jgi:flagellar basal-body rod protein FlgF
MENAQLISLSRQIALQRQMDVVANNMANINTTGFKMEQILFEDYEMPLANGGGISKEPSLAFVQDWATVRDFSPGAITQTGNPLDVAIEGDGFLVVDTPQGERWTKAGSLQISNTGMLVTLQGDPVMGENGPVVFGPDDTSFVIDANGSVLVDGASKAKLRVVEFENTHELTPIGTNLYSGGEPNPAVNTRIIQGSIERSNVSGVVEMAEMIRVSRAYQTLTSIMQRQDDIRRSAVQRLGDLNA